ncbi:MAG TPA: hypothetical protein DCZ92_15535 [Elusimicrobia bacterium]|nr:MAG: hypothetical protein A2016_12065 [Elusimicrobia bacterium GWF2_62_30]HBA62192.1 hypothetical protein [Elusimicrobiota bacterium]
MKCPNCGLVAPDGTEVCAQCQIVFSKLEESLVKKALQAHSARIKEPVKEIVPQFYRLALLFFATAALWFLVQAQEKRKIQEPGLPAQAETAPEQPAVPAAAETP